MVVSQKCIGCVHTKINISSIHQSCSKMFLAKNNKSSYYQIVYFVDGKRTTHSTKKTNEQEAVQYLEEFKKNLANPSGAITQKTFSKNTFTLSKFKEEFLEYIKPVRAKKYVGSNSYSFNYLIEYAGDLPLNKIKISTVDKFIHSTFTRVQRGAHHYYRTLKAALNKAVEWKFLI